MEKEKKHLKHLKALYIKELEGKSIFEEILKKYIEEVKEQSLSVQNEKFTKKRSKNEYLDKNERAILIDKLINDEKILSLIYDKTFYGSNKKIEIPSELLNDDDDDEDFKAVL